MLPTSELSLDNCKLMGHPGMLFEMQANLPASAPMSAFTSVDLEGS